MSKDILFPDDKEFKAHLAMPLALNKLKSEDEERNLLSLPPDLLKKKKKKRRLGVGLEKASDGDHSAMTTPTRGTRKPIKFGAEFSSSGSDTENGEGNEVKDALHRPSLPAVARTDSSSGATLVERVRAPVPAQVLDYEKEIEAVKDRLRMGARGEVEYSDYEEEDVTSLRGRGTERDGWRPAFLDRHSVQGRVRPRSMPASAPAPVPVPATPSLVKALDRIAVAQREGFALSRGHGQGHGDEGHHDAHGAGQGQKEGEAWDGFWREVKKTTRRQS